MTKQELKKQVLGAVEDLADSIEAVGDYLYRNPELGYKEERATAHVADLLEKAGFEVERNMAVTGVTARPGKDAVGIEQPGPTLAVLGELDAIVCKEHPHADENGAVHACGHNVQTAVMAGIALAFQKADAFRHFGGNLVFMAVPAEEFVEMAFRSRLKQEGRLTWFGGKQEMVAKGLFDRIDMAMMMHSLNLAEGIKAFSASSGNGFIGKTVRFMGKEAHAGSAPHEGVNALNAAMLAMNNIHAQRETFRDKDRVRVHPIITKGGDVVNVVPADVRMECYVRAASIESLETANARVDRALKAGAAAVGAGIEIRDMPGYLPLRNNRAMDRVFLDNLSTLCPAEGVIREGDFSGSLDFGDISHIIPGIHPFFSGVTGSLHSKEFRISDPETAYLLPVKSLALTIIDLLWDNAEAARKIVSGFKPAMTREAYLAWLAKTEKAQVIPME